MHLRCCLALRYRRTNTITKWNSKGQVDISPTVPFTLSSQLSHPTALSSLGPHVQVLTYAEDSRPDVHGPFGFSPITRESLLGHGLQVRTATNIKLSNTSCPVYQKSTSQNTDLISPVTQKSSAYPLDSRSLIHSFIHSHRKDCTSTSVSGTVTGAGYPAGNSKGIRSSQPACLIELYVVRTLCPAQFFLHFQAYS